MGAGKGFLGGLLAVPVFETFAGAGFAFTFSFDGGRDSLQEGPVLLQDRPEQT